MQTKRALLNLMNHKLDQFQQALDRIEQEVAKMAMTQHELAAALNDVNAKLVKIGGETTTLVSLVADLKTQLANNPVSQEVQDAFDAVAKQAGVVDAMVPDEPAPPT